MNYEKSVLLKNGFTCFLRNGCISDGQEVFEVFNQTHAETENLLSYPDENSFDAEQEGEFLQKIADSPDEMEMVAVLNGRIVGIAGIHAVGRKYKVRHRVEFGISILKAFWNLGIGTALLNACVECAKEAGYAQLELNVVSDNGGARAIYTRAGFTEYGRNPKGFNSRSVGYQETVSMRLEL